MSPWIAKRIKELLGDVSDRCTQPTNQPTNNNNNNQSNQQYDKFINVGRCYVCFVCLRSAEKARRAWRHCCVIILSLPPSLSLSLHNANNTSTCSALSPVLDRDTKAFVKKLWEQIVVESIEIQHTQT
jgi:hypothetical protein